MFYFFFLEFYRNYLVFGVFNIFIDPFVVFCCFISDFVVTPLTYFEVVVDIIHGMLSRFEKMN